MGITLSILLVKNNPHVYSKLFYYQINKLETEKGCSILFIGDSSLGNAIDAKKFTELSSRQTLNVALNGLYGYAGSYNMLKAAVDKQKTIKDVVVMQTIDMLTREVSIEGYVRSLTTMSDFLEVEDKINYFNHYINFVRTLEPSDFILSGDDRQIKEDYIVQKGTFNSNNLNIPKTQDINLKKIEYLLKIKEFCLANKINLTYVHGPIWHESKIKSEDYILTCDSILLANGINVIGEAIPIMPGQIGNTADHILPSCKLKFTNEYFELLSTSLGHPSSCESQNY